jgi:hypothetical protein
MVMFGLYRSLSTLFRLLHIEQAKWICECRNCAIFMPDLFCRDEALSYRFAERKKFANTPAKTGGERALKTTRSERKP